MDETSRRNLEILNRMEGLVRSGRRAVVRRATEDHIHPNTLRDWLRNKERAARGAYKSSHLPEIARALTALEQSETTAVYAFALEQLALDPASQSDLAKYHGTYYLRHNFQLAHTTDLRWIRINSGSAPRFTVFITTFRFMGRRHGCDGFVLLRPRRIHLLGLSPSAIFFANLDPVVDPSHALIQGSALFNSILEERIYSSNIVLHQRRPDSLNRHEAGFIDSHLTATVPASA